MPKATHFGGGGANFVPLNRNTLCASKVLSTLLLSDTVEMFIIFPVCYLSFTIIL